MSKKTDKFVEVCNLLKDLSEDELERLAMKLEIERGFRREYSTFREFIYSRIALDRAGLRNIISRLLCYDGYEAILQNDADRWRFVNERLILSFRNDFEVLVKDAQYDIAMEFAHAIAEYIDEYDSDILSEEDRHIMASLIRAKLLVKDFGMFMRVFYPKRVSPRR